MRYTKYNIKRKKDNNILKFIVSLLLTIILAGAMGVGIATLVFKLLPSNNLDALNTDTTNNSSQTTSTDTNNSNTSNTASNNNVFDLVQCGYFASKDNAQLALNKVGSNYGGFIAQDGDKYRVVAGIYTGADTNTAITNLKNSGIDSVKVSITLNPSDKVQSQIAAICDGYVQILNKTYESDVKEINTKDFKDYVGSLESLSEGDQLAVLTELKTYISNLPEQIKKENVASELDYLYNILVKFKQ